MDTKTTFIQTGTMRGPHGGLELHWGVTADGETLFNDRQRHISGRIAPEQWERGGACGRPHPYGPYTGEPGQAAVRWGYLQGYAYTWAREADQLGQVTK